jgi:hypothetical protein
MSHSLQDMALSSQTLALKEARSAALVVCASSDLTMAATAVDSSPRRNRNLTHNQREPPHTRRHPTSLLLEAEDRKSYLTGPIQTGVEFLQRPAGEVIWSRFPFHRSRWVLFKTVRTLEAAIAREM